MSSVERMLFLNQKFNILQMKINHDLIMDAYAFAWHEGVYPAFNDDAEWHLPYEQFFDVSAEMLGELAKQLDDAWLPKSIPTFYELEERYITEGSNWTRSLLISACKYMRLAGLFDADLWKIVCKESKCPTEAHTIIRPFRKGDIYFN